MISMGCDHAAFEFKSKIAAHLKNTGVEVKDFGAYDSLVPTDYPDVAIKVAQAVASGECEKGILICGTGIGMSMAANKVSGIRCALCSDTFSARATREHNDANILAMGERVLGLGLALDIVETFLKTQFSNADRHVRRVEKVMSIEKK